MRLRKNNITHQPLPPNCTSLSLHLDKWLGFGDEPILYQAFLVAQMVKRLPAKFETQVWSLGREDPLEKEMATHSGTLAWKIPWTEEEPCMLQSMGLQRVGHNWSTSISFLLKYDDTLDWTGLLILGNKPHLQNHYGLSCSVMSNSLQPHRL